MPRDRNQPAPDRKRRLTLRAPATAALVTACALLGVGGTWAYFVDAAPVPGATIRAGTLDLLVDWQKDVTWPAVQLAPNAPTVREFTVTNSGDVPSRVEATFASSGGLAPHTTARIYPKIGATPCSAAATDGVVGPIQAFPTAQDDLAAGESRAYCLVLSVPGAPISAAGQSLSYTLTVTATQREV